MRFLYLLATGLFTCLSVQAQTPIDTYNSFPTADPPQGWTYNLSINSGDLFYFGGSDNNPSLRLDATGEYAMVEIAESPESLSYYVRSTGFSPPVAPGTTFSVQESTDGIGWNNLRVLDEANLSGDFTFFEDNPDPMTKFIRFYYTNKASGSNIALDEVTITKTPAGPDARLMVYRDELKILSGHSVALSAEENLLLQLHNEGLEESLQIINVSISGTDATAFSTIPAPTNIAPEESDILQINVFGEVGETYEALLEITTNDDYNPVYEIELIGFGGAFAPEPEMNPSDFEVDNVRTFGFDLSWSHAEDLPERYLVLQNTTGANDFPEDGVDYDVSEYIGDSRVVMNELTDHFSPRYIAAGTTYYYQIFSVNGSGDYTNYLQADPLSGTITTPDNMMEEYYNGLNSNESDFVSELSDVIFPHQQLDYWDYPQYLINEFEMRDTTDNQHVVTGYYTGYEYLFQHPFQWDVMSREHVLPHSWFATYEAYDEVEYTDYHNLFPVHNDSANIVRLNHPYGIVENVTHAFHAGKVGYNSEGVYVYEPRDFAKGRAARAIFYMLTTYNEQIGGEWQLPANQDQELLKDWHFTYLPDGREMARNDYIHSIQGNRNPFIDSVYFACRIDFYTMNYISDAEDWCLSVDVAESARLKPVVFPNPSSGQFKIRWNGIVVHDTEIMMVDNSGRQVKKMMLEAGLREYDVLVNDLPPGFYLLQWRQDQRNGQWPVVIRR